MTEIGAGGIQRLDAEAGEVSVRIPDDKAAFDIGPGSIKASTETRACIFCHTPHGASSDPPLWNRYSSGANYSTYHSSTAKASVGQPTGASKLCLSCHDGANPDYLWMTDDKKFEEGELVKRHPISFVYDSALANLDGGLKDPSEASSLGRTIAEDLLGLGYDSVNSLRGEDPEAMYQRFMDQQGRLHEFRGRRGGKRPAAGVSVFAHPDPMA